MKQILALLLLVVVMTSVGCSESKSGLEDSYPATTKSSELFDVISSPVVETPTPIPISTPTPTPTPIPTVEPTPVPTLTPTPTPEPTPEPTQEPAPERAAEAIQTTETVYWVSKGEVYHRTSSCRTLSRSKNIYSGSVNESGKPRACKVCY